MSLLFWGNVFEAFFPRFSVPSLMTGLLNLPDCLRSDSKVVSLCTTEGYTMVMIFVVKSNGCEGGLVINAFVRADMERPWLFVLLMFTPLNTINIATPNPLLTRQHRPCFQPTGRLVHFQLVASAVAGLQLTHHSPPTHSSRG